MQVVGSIAIIEQSQVGGLLSATQTLRMAGPVDLGPNWGVARHS